MAEQFVLPSDYSDGSATMRVTVGDDIIFSFGLRNAVQFASSGSRYSLEFRMAVAKFAAAARTEIERNKHPVIRHLNDTSGEFGGDEK